MSSDLDIQFDFRNQRFKDAQRGLEALGKNVSLSSQTAARVLRSELKTMLQATARDLSIRHSAGWPGGTTERTLSRRSGRAIASIMKSPRVSGREIDDIQGSIGGVGYLKTHEFGAIIRATKSKYLTIPLPAALNANGTPKKRNARQWTRTFIIKSKKGNLLIVRQDGASIVPLYVLKTEVKIPARLGMGAALRKRVNEFADYVPARMVERMVRERFR